MRSIYRNWPGVKSPADGAREGDDVDGSRARALERGRGRRGRRSSRVHVVYHGDRTRRRGRREERLPDVRTPSVTGKSPLSGHLPRAAEKRQNGERPPGGELTRERLRGVDASPTAAIGVARNPGQRPGARRRDDLYDEVGCEPRDPAEPALLPAADERAGSLVVRDGRTRRGKGKAPAGALAAPLDRPGRRRATAGAERPAEAKEAGAALVAEQAALPPAGDTALREQKIEEAGAHAHPVGP